VLILLEPDWMVSLLLSSGAKVYAPAVFCSRKRREAGDELEPDDLDAVSPPHTTLSHPPNRLMGRISG